MKLASVVSKLAALFALAAFASGAYAEPLEMGLDEVVSLALQNDESLKIALSDKAVAYEDVRQASRAKGVTFTLTHKSGIVENQATGESVNSYSNAFAASYPLYTGGLLEGNIAKSAKVFESKGFDAKSASGDLKLRAIESFYQAKLCEELKGVAEESLARAQAHTKNVTLFFESGKVGKTDLLNSEVELSNAKGDLIEAQKNLSVALKKVNSLVGLPLNAPITLKDPLPYYKPFSADLEECVETALGKHPKLASARLLVDAAHAGVTMARSTGRPTATLAAEEDLASKNWPGTDRNSLTIGVEVDFVIHDAGVSRSKVASAKESLAGAELNRDAIADSIVLAVNENYENLTAAREKLAESGTSADAAREAYNIALIRYNAGTGTNADVIDAHRALSAAGSDYAQDAYDCGLYLARLENAMGIDL
jgi:outer membrane protein TolC